MVRSVPPRFDRVALKARRKNLAVCATTVDTACPSSSGEALHAAAQPALQCSICALPVRGVAWACGACGHGGHWQCVRAWVTAAAARGEPEWECPTGCGCHCGIASLAPPTRQAAVIPYDAAGASARACGSVEGSTLGAAEERGWARWRAPLMGGGVPTGAAFPRAGHIFLPGGSAILRPSHGSITRLPER
ncbi:Hypothetical protein EMIHUDRAFT_254569 [Emiliania huxleyi CCMP1516]|uniref:WDR59/RTC1-like RING zinc finger domain-containing protein n=2 Tax=Emiliania huxleyi TaxID=2903 RepID=A0A0D3JQ29_EMIH1|nr:Hypothetical protein EMIHUDRAFT_254569 [Emiliania huxleyi CCMP1516]EOD25614.1 Hypothetical protein EMIHUDRAFT_254569 [Emiliania huxleyi CCMP1516]|eukprot:XP_005778043.1 Hypothetical protein EMIHUDRAFT_254569 [Emiliania huxleyi CCMP1516]